MPLTDHFVQVSRSRVCPVCHHADRCMVSTDPAYSMPLCLCARIESPLRYGTAAWLHFLDEDRHIAKEVSDAK